MSTKQLHIGILGAGRIGKVHAETLAFRLPEVRTLAIADVNREAAQAVAARCGIPTVAETSAEIFANSAIEAVLICSSTNTHADLIVQAAQAGKHIFCEKPIAHDLGQIDRALAAVEQAGVKLQIGFNRRFDANFARVRQAVVSGEIGTPRLLHIVSRDPAPPLVSYIRVSGGMFLDMTIHDFDMARFLIGDEVDKTAMDFRRLLPEIRWQSCLSPGSGTGSPDWSFDLVPAYFPCRHVRNPMMVLPSSISPSPIILASSLRLNQRASMRSSSIGVASPAVRSWARKMVMRSATKPGLAQYDASLLHLPAV